MTDARGDVVRLRKAMPEDAAGIAAVHAASWQSAYPGVLPDEYLAGLSAARLTRNYQLSLRNPPAGHATFVAEHAGQVVGFTAGGRARRQGYAEGEIETLYIQDEWRERGLGRGLIQALGGHLAAEGCASAMVWVLAENPARFFYAHLGGRLVGRETIRFAGRPVDQLAYLWAPISALLAPEVPR